MSTDKIAPRIKIDDIPKIKGERWAEVVGGEDFYKISTKGRLLSIPRLKPHSKRKSGFQKVGGFLYNQQTHHLGYKIAKIVINGQERGIKVHRLVAMAFIANPMNKPCVNHKNGIRDDNRVENLEWATHSENNTHGVHRRKKDRITNQKTYECTIGQGINPESVPEMYAALEECVLQIEYLHDKFKPTGSGNTVLSKARTVLQKAKLYKSVEPLTPGTK